MVIWERVSRLVSGEDTGSSCSEKPRTARVIFELSKVRIGLETTEFQRGKRKSIPRFGRRYAATTAPATSWLFDVAGGV